MKAFEYAAPRTEEEAVQLLAELPGRTEILAGGTDLVGLMRKMVVTPDRVVNIMEIPSLKQLERVDDGSLLIGAAVTLDELLASPYLEPYPAVADAIHGINSMQLQCQGTIGGEICQRPQCWYFRNGYGLLADQGRLVEQGENSRHAIIANHGPAKFVHASRIAPALIALGAHVRVRGPRPQDEHFFPLAELYRIPRHQGQRETILEPGQLVTHIILPPAEGRLNATYEVRHGCGPDFPLAAAAVAMTVRSGLIQEATVVLGQVAPIPWISLPARDVLVGSPISETLAERAGQAAVSEATPLSRNAYKVQLAKVSVKRAILRAAGLETGGF